MTTSDDDSYWIERLKSGDRQATEVLWQRYFDRLVTLARSKLGQHARRVVDEEDVALSAIHSLFEGAEEGQFRKLDDRQDLWKLLATITIRKVHGQRRRDDTQKRGSGRVRGDSVWMPSGDAQWGLPVVPDGQPTPEEAAIFVETVSAMMSQLDDPQLQTIAQRKLEGFS